MNRYCFIFYHGRIQIIFIGSGINEELEFPKNCCYFDVRYEIVRFYVSDLFSESLEKFILSPEVFSFEHMALVESGWFSWGILRILDNNLREHKDNMSNRALSLLILLLQISGVEFVGTVVAKMGFQRAWVALV